MCPKRCPILRPQHTPQNLRHCLSHALTDELANDAELLVPCLPKDWESQCTRLLALVEKVDIGACIGETMLVDRFIILDLFRYGEELLLSHRVKEQIFVLVLVIL